MSKVFKRNRMRSIKENSIVKYVLYALGEIILISLGILIAMEINNRNELAKNEARVDKLLTQIQHDILVDVEMANQIIDVYSKKDSLMNRVLSRHVTENEYHENFNYYTLITSVATFQIKDESYKNLMRSSEAIPAKYDSLVIKLDQLYRNNKAAIDEVNEALSDFTKNMLEKWSQKYTWYSEFYINGPSEEELDYFLNDPFYKNDIATYQTYAVENLLTMTRNFQLESALVYHQIAKELKQTKEKPELINTIVADISDATRNKMIGTYLITPTFNIKVFDVGGQLYCQATNQSKFAVYPQSDSVLTASVVEIKMIFKTDSESGDFEGFTLIQNSNENYFVKEK